MGLETIFIVIGGIVVIGIFVSVLKAKSKTPKDGPRSKSMTRGPN